MSFRATVVSFGLVMSLLLSDVAAADSMDSAVGQGSSATANNLSENVPVEDPWESWNRKVFRFNTVVDKYTLRPLAKFYAYTLPSVVSDGLSNFIDNVRLPITLANDVLQGEMIYFADDTMRLLVNTVFGFGGFIDVATEGGIPPHKTDLGLTWAKWGYTNSNYVVIPFLGPSTTRDSTGLYLDTYFSPITYIDDNKTRLGLYTLTLIDLRAKFLPYEENVVGDPYTFYREAYLQFRYLQIHGEPMDDDFGDDESIDDWDEDEW